MKRGMNELENPTLKESRSSVIFMCLFQLG